MSMNSMGLPMHGSGSVSAVIGLPGAAALTWLPRTPAWISGPEGGTGMN